MRIGPPRLSRPPEEHTATLSLALLEETKLKLKALLLGLTRHKGHFFSEHRQDIDRPDRLPFTRT